MRRTLAVVGGAALVAALLTGCSSDGDEDGAGGTPSESSSASEATSGEALTNAGQEYCNALEDLRRAQEDQEGDPEALQEAVDDLAEAAPDGDSAELQRIEDAYDEYADQVEDRIGELPDVPGVDVDQFVEDNRDALDSLSEQYLQPVQADLDEVVAQGREDCGLEP